MSTLTVRLPDDTHARMKVLARHRAVSVNKLMEELCTIAVTQHDAETRFRALAARVGGGRTPYPRKARCRTRRRGPGSTFKSSGLAIAELILALPDAQLEICSDPGENGYRSVSRRGTGENIAPRNRSEAQILADELLPSGKAVSTAATTVAQ